MAQVSFQEVLDAMEGVTYLVEPAGRVVACGRRNWSEFASENGGGELAHPEHIIGRPVFDFVSGEDVVAAYDGYMRRLFDGSIPGVTFEFRCDAPDVRRDLWMTIRPVESGGRVAALLFQSIVINELSRPPIGLFDYAGMNRRLTRQRSYPVVTMCSYCHNAAREPAAGEPRIWMEPEAYYRSGGATDVQVSHGICPACYAMHVAPFIDEGSGEAPATDQGPGAPKV